MPPFSAHDRRAIERLARESQVPPEEVARLYGDALARREAGARVRAFLGIIAMRDVRETLRRRSARP